MKFRACCGVFADGVLFHLGRRTELDDLAGRNLHGGARAGIAAHAFGFLLHAERTQPRQGQPFALAERLHRDPDHGVDGLAGVYLRDVRVEGDGLDKLRFVHGVVREETNLSVLTY